jgi:tetratricopeptide (TPR) repeat protein
MKRIHSVVVILLFCSLHGIAGSLPYSTVERVRTITLDGLHAAYNFDFPSANKSFDDALSVEPLSPRPYIGKATIVFWRFVLNKNDRDREEFLLLADRAIDAAEKYQEKYGEDAEAQLCLGTIYAYRSFLYGRTKSYLKGAWDGKKSYDYFYDALKLDPKLYDAYLGVGLFHYFVTFIPKPLQWVVSVMGIKGDSEAGIREIRMAAQKGTYTKAEAQYFLAQFLPWQNGEFDTSEKLLLDLSKQYPSNNLLKFTLAVWEVRRNDVRSAKEKLRPIIEQPEKDDIGVIPFARYKLAECYFRLNEFDLARQEYGAFLRDHKEQIYVATSCYRIGICFELSGKRDSALVYYQRAAKADRKFGDDASSARASEHYLKSILTREDTLFLSAQNAQKSGDADQATKSYSSITTLSGVSPEILAQSVYGLGEILYERASYIAAAEQFQKIFSLPVNKEQWLQPWAHYQAGMCYVKSGNNSQAVKEFEKALDYDEYDFKNWLEFRSRRELDQLKK